MNGLQIQQLLAQLDGTKSNDCEIDAVLQLRLLEPKRFVELMLDLYRSSTKLKPRCTAVYFTTSYARENDVAVEIGKLAVFDRSKRVRFRGCGLLAYSLRLNVIDTLRHAQLLVPEQEVPDFTAAIDAIENQNHHYFYDRDHSGMVKWEFQDT